MISSISQYKLKKVHQASSVSYKYIDTIRSQLVDNVGPSSSAVVGTGNRMNTVSSTVWVVSK